MKFLRDSPIQVKVLLPPLILAFGLIGQYSFSLFGLNQLTNTIEMISSDLLARIGMIDDIVLLTEQIQSDVFHISVLKSMGLDENEIDPIRSRLETRISNLNVRYGQITKNWELNQIEQSLMDQIKSPMDNFRSQALQAATLVLENPAMGVIMVRSSTIPFEELHKLLTDLRAYEESLIFRGEEKAISTADRINRIVALTSMAISIVAFLATLFISNSQITRPIMRMTGAMRRLAEGNITSELPNPDRKDEIGEMTQALTFFRQTIIAKEQADAELVESQRTLVTLLDNLPGLAYRCLNDKNWTMVFLSDSCLSLTGYSSEELLQEKNQLIHTEDQDRVWESVQKALQEKKPFQIEYRIHTTTGKEKWVWEQGSGIFSKKGEVQFLEGYITDITNRKNFEDTLERRMSALEHLNDLYVGRESRMIELKKEVNQALEEAGKERKYESPQQVEELRLNSRSHNS